MAADALLPRHASGPGLADAGGCTRRPETHSRGARMNVGGGPGSGWGRGDVRSAPDRSPGFVPGAAGVSCAWLAGHRRQQCRQSLLSGRSWGCERPWHQTPARAERCPASALANSLRCPWGSDRPQARGLSRSQVIPRHQAAAAGEPAPARIGGEGSLECLVGLVPARVCLRELWGRRAAGTLCPFPRGMVAGHFPLAEGAWVGTLSSGCAGFLPEC